MKILITGCITWSEEEICEIEDIGHKVTFIQDERIPLKNQGIDVSSFEGVICNGLFLYNDINKFNNLKYIQLTSAGYDRVPMKYILEKEIIINNARGVYSVPMAEFALCGILQLYKQSRFFSSNQKENKWIKSRNLQELYNKNVCIIGCGSVGSECAKRLNAFECNVCGVDINTDKRNYFEKIYTLSDMDKALSVSDIVILTLPLTDKTKNLINKNKFDKMKQGCIFVNIARGSIVNTNDLVEALETKLLGAVLDVFETEPLNEDSSLWKKENVILTPHNSFVGEGNRARLQKLIIKNLSRM